jgi:ribonuclease E
MTAAAAAAVASDDTAGATAADEPTSPGVEDRDGGRRRGRRGAERDRDVGTAAPPETAAAVASSAAPADMAETAEAVGASDTTAAPAVPVRVEPFVLPTDTLAAVARDAGLEWVNSDVEKIRAVQQAMAAEPAPIRVPRERRPVVVVDDGPLVLVETRQDLAQLKLPFERAQPAGGEAQAAHPH